MSKVASLENFRNKRELTTQVYDCGKCHGQGAELCLNGHIECGGEDCTARWAADWYEPTDKKSIAKNLRPRIKKDEQIYRCGYCLYPYFHIQQDNSITCYRETCKRKTLFRWQWLEGVAA